MLTPKYWLKKEIFPPKTLILLNVAHVRIQHSSDYVYMIDIMIH